MTESGTEKEAKEVIRKEAETRKELIKCKT
jgi:hypothetical protein